MKYYAPVAEVELFDAIDVVTTSGGGNHPDPYKPIEGEPDVFED